MDLIESSLNLIKLSYTDVFMAKSVADPGFPVGGGGRGRGTNLRCLAETYVKMRELIPLVPVGPIGGGGRGHCQRRPLDLSMQVARTQY